MDESKDAMSRGSFEVTADVVDDNRDTVLIEAYR